MIQLMGGEQAFITKMDSLFTMHLPDEFFAETEDVTKEGLLGGYVHATNPAITSHSYTHGPASLGKPNTGNVRS